MLQPRLDLKSYVGTRSQPETEGFAPSTLTTLVEKNEKAGGTFLSPPDRDPRRER